MMPTAHSIVCPPSRLEGSVWRLAQVEWVAEVERVGHRQRVQSHRYCYCVSVSEEADGNVWKRPGNGDSEGLRGSLLKS